MITKLADKWRKEFASASVAPYCAQQLEAVLPKWTRITEKSIEAIPTSTETVLVSGKGKNATCEEVLVTELAEIWIGWWMRPLCDLDYPPEDL